MTLTGPRRLYSNDRLAVVHPSPDGLTPDNYAAFHHDGYLAVENVLSPEEVADAKAALADLLYGRVAEYKGLQPEPEVAERWPTMTAEERGEAVRKVWQFVGHSPKLDDLTRHSVLQGILTSILGEPCRLIQDMALLKPPLIGTEKPWHQDMAYFGWGPPEKVIGVWIALDPATLENGCMHVLPGTNNEGPVPHAHVRDCQIPDDRVQVERDVAVPLQPGGVLFFSSMLHHGTPPNDSPNRRWAIQYHYAAESAVPMDKVEHARLFFEGDIYAGCRGGTGLPLSEIPPQTFYEGR